MEEVFESFDPEPIGAASIGQVHRAVLKGTGRKVVVKVQYPEVERLFRGDVRTLILFCKIAQPVHVPALEEIEKQFMTEFDYLEECRKLTTVRGNLVKGGWAPGRCQVPEPVPELSSKNVLVMEELEGAKLVDALHADAERYAAMLGKTLEEFLKEEEMNTLKDGERRGPSKEVMDAYIAVQDAKRRASNLAGLVANAVWFWWPGYEKKRWVGKETLPINHGRMVDELIDVHGHEIFVDGYFNADPHPGNMLLLDQKTGSPRIGLIDYGQVKELTRENIVILSKMMIALQEDNEPEMARLIFEAGYKTKEMRPDLAAKYARGEAERKAWGEARADDAWHQRTILRRRTCTFFSSLCFSQSRWMRTTRRCAMVSTCRSSWRSWKLKTLLWTFRGSLSWWGELA
jgi:aarF domain-containing kinase